MKKKQTPKTLVYIVQDYKQALCGVHTTLAKAAAQYEQVLAEGLSEDDIAALVEEYGDDFHDELEYPACIVVYELDANWLWSYDSINEVQRALLSGERYD